jgi:small subunit ribosomal protein S20
VAQHKSAKKRILTNSKKRARNQAYNSSVRSAVKKVRVALEKGLNEEANKLFVEAQSLLHKAASRGLVHKNNASRRVARLSALLKSKSAAK